MNKLAVSAIVATVPVTSASLVVLCGIHPAIVYVPAKICAAILVLAVLRGRWKKELALPSQWGILLGIAMAGAVMAAFSLVEADGTGIRETLDAAGLSGTAVILAGFFTAVVNSFLEEGVFRVALLESLPPAVGKAGGNLLQGLLFLPHHAVVLFAYFPPPTACLCLGGVLLAGVVWGLCRQMGMTLTDLFVSHLLVDAAVIAAGLALYEGVIG